MELLEEAGANVRFSDPYVPSIALFGRERKSVELTPEALERADVIVVLVDHGTWPVELLRASSTLLFDAVNALGYPARDDHERL
jgi:UDP-N-acetyl-D-glucosamine dehydrogenase